MVPAPTSAPNDLASDPSALVGRHLLAGRSLLDVFHAIQDEVGYVPAATVAPLSVALNLSRAEVHGVLTYYSHFRTKPPAATVIQLCRAEACRSMGTEALAAHVEARTGCRFDHHADAEHPAVELESVYCLGQCALSPAMMINERLYAKVTPQKFDALFAAAEKEVS